MKIYNLLINKFKDQRGAVSIIVAIIVLFVLIGIMALAVDVGYLYATKNELQNIADAGALAGAGQLGKIYVGMTAAEQDEYDFENVGRPLIQAAVQGVVTGDQKNIAGGKDITINDDDDIIIFNINLAGGNLKYDGPNIYTLPDGVRVKVYSNGPVSTFFGKIFGITGWPVSADATAALTTIKDVGPGEMKLPIGLSQTWFEPDPFGHCEDTITFSPTTDSCAGWHNFFDAINASAMKNKLIGFINNDPLEGDDCLSPPCGDAWLDGKFGEDDYPVVDPTGSVNTDDSIFEFQGGVIAALFTGRALMWEVPEGPASDDYVVPKDDDGIPGQDIEGSGQIATFPALFDYFRFRDGDDLDDYPNGLSFDTTGDGFDDFTVTDPDAVWTTTVPVYEDSEPCINPNTDLKIIGFAIVRVVMPNPPPDSTVTVRIDCFLTFIGGHGGGGTTGTLRASIPNLVE